MSSNDSNIMVSSQFFIVTTLKQLEFSGGLLCILFNVMCLRKKKNMFLFNDVENFNDWIKKLENVNVFVYVHVIQQILFKKIKDITMATYKCYKLP